MDLRILWVLVPIGAYLTWWAFFMVVTVTGIAERRGWGWPFTDPPQSPERHREQIRYLMGHRDEND
jgi:hypothetical protein